MEKEVTVLQKVCDFCGSTESVYYTCARCGKDACYLCNEHAMIECDPGVHFTGHLSSHYCTECFTFLNMSPTPLFAAYTRIASLRKELENFNISFSERRKQAEAEVERLYKAEHESD